MVAVVVPNFVAGVVVGLVVGLVLVGVVLWLAARYESAGLREVESRIEREEFARAIEGDDLHRADLFEEDR